MLLRPKFLRYPLRRHRPAQLKQRRAGALHYPCINSQHNQHSFLWNLLSGSLFLEYLGAMEVVEDRLVEILNLRDLQMSKVQSDLR